MTCSCIDFSDAVVDNVHFPEKVRQIRIFSDLSVEGLFLHVRFNRKYFVHRSLVGDGRMRMLGGFPSIGVAQAREQARYFNERDRAAGRPIVTFAECFTAFMKRKTSFRSRAHVHLLERMKRSILDRRVNPFCDQALDEITKDDIAKLVTAIRDGGTPFLARQCLSRLRSMFGWAAREKRFALTPARNPMADLTNHTFDLAKEHVVLTRAELALYAIASGRLPTARERALAKSLLLSGFRIRDLALMRWLELDLDKKVWTSTSSSGHLVNVHLSDAMCQLLAGLRSSRLNDHDDDYVFGTRGRPFSRPRGFKASLDRLIEQAAHETGPGASVRRWRFVDLRHTVIALLIDQGLDSRMIKIALGGRPTILLFNHGVSHAVAIRAAMNRHADRVAAFNTTNIREQD
ncbi:tyrosine-type recombinase/integrase [Rhizobium leguminosarum]|uniref:tyrosine-type recombinase/integrase n=1 Tax=Rhizobium leguminosarum TaxID=384 RepID=UPI003F994EE9